MIAVVNDYKTTIPGTKTFWHYLLEWVNGEWVGDCDFSLLATTATAAATRLRPTVIVRNATYFGPFVANCPVISFLQDIMPLGSHARSQQLLVGQGSAVVVFNSAFTASCYPELAHNSVVIPIGIDFDHFRPLDQVAKQWDVCWIGAPSEVKGWNALLSTISASDLSFFLVSKAPLANLRSSRVGMATRVDHDELLTIINSCRVGLCTSTVETQHLAGIEMAACGLPVVAPPVGVYFDAPPWARLCSDPGNYAAILSSTMKNLPSALTTRTQAQALSLAACRQSWLRLVDRIGGISHVVA